jgi:anti-sigma B factor antagonist
MEIEQRTEGDVTTLFLKGKMLGGVGDKLFREKVEALVEAGRVNIVLDLSDLPYMDSAALGEIVRCFTTVSRKNGKLKLINIPERLRDLLSVLGGDDSDDDWPGGAAGVTSLGTWSRVKKIRGHKS